MAEAAFDTLGAARRLKAAGIASEHAEAIVGVMSQSLNRLVTVEHFDAAIASLRTELGTRIDTKMRAEIMRAILIAVGVMIAANALSMTILGIYLTHGGGI